MFKHLLILLFAFTSLPGISIAGQPDIDEVIKQIQTRYEKITNFHAKFEQEAEVRALDTVEKASGEVWFKKPGKMRWDYHKPAKDIIVSDGEDLWYYLEEENQAVKSSLSHLGQETNTTSLLSGLENISSVFTAEFVDRDDIKTTDGAYLIELTPASENTYGDNSYDKVIISVDKEDLMVNTIYLFDPFGNRTKITLSEFTTEKEISDSRFKFTPPKNAEIVTMPSVN